MQGKATDVKGYWIQRGKGYSDEFKKHGLFARRYFKRQQDVLLHVLRNLEFESVLEIGCGFGRITKLILDEFPDLKKYKGIDLSPHQIEKCRTIVKSEKVELSVGTVQDLEEADNNYDLVIAVEVLMHIPFGEIDSVLGQMVKVSRKYIVNLDWHGLTGAELGGYCFAHDYTCIYRNIRCKVCGITLIPKSPIYSVGFGLDDGLRIARIHSELQQIYVACKSKNDIHYHNGSMTQCK